MRTSILAPLGLLLLLVGCDVKIDRQAMSLRYDEHSDSLEGMSIYEGISSTSNASLPKALKQVREYLDGGRKIYLGPICFNGEMDFDEDLERTDPSQSELLWANRQVVIDSVHLYLDEKERFSGAQRFHVAHFSRVLSIFNRNVNRTIIEDFQDPESTPPDADARTRELVLEFALNGGTWLAIEGDEFVFQYPMSFDDWRKTQVDFLSWAMEEKQDHGHRLITQLVGYIQNMGWEDELFTVRLGAVLNGVFHLEIFNDAEYDDGLLEEMKRAGYIFDHDFSSSDARLALDPLTPADR